MYALQLQISTQQHTLVSQILLIRKKTIRLLCPQWTDNSLLVISIMNFQIVMNANENFYTILKYVMVLVVVYRTKVSCWVWCCQVTEFLLGFLVFIFRITATIIIKIANLITIVSRLPDKYFKRQLVVVFSTMYRQFLMFMY